MCVQPSSALYRNQSPDRFSNIVSVPSIFAGVTVKILQTPPISSISLEGREHCQGRQLETQIPIRHDVQKRDVDFSEILNAIQESKLLCGPQIFNTLDILLDMTC